MIRLALEIPQLEDDEAEGPQRISYERWARVVDKARWGSEKVIHMLRMAVAALLEAKTGRRDLEERPLAEYWAAVASTIPAACPFPSAEVMLASLGASGHLDVEDQALVMRAVHVVVDRWSGSMLADLCDRTMWNMQYDAIEAVAAFLFVLCAYATPSAPGAPREP